MNGTILGQVVSQANCGPVAGAKVLIRGPSPAGKGLSLNTRSDGAFVARGLLPGLWEVATQGAARVTVDVLARATTPVMLEVREGSSSAPEPDLAPWQWPAMAAGSPTGAAAEPDLYLERPGAAGTDTGSCLGGPEPGSWAPTEPTPADAVFFPQRPGAAVGWVRDSRRGQYVANATITCFSSQGSAPDIAPVTDAAGRFFLDGLSEGLWIVRALAQDGRVGESVLAIRAGLRSQFDIELDAPGGPDSVTGLL